MAQEVEFDGRKRNNDLTRLSISPRSAIRTIGFCLLLGSIAYSWLSLAPPAPRDAYVLNPAYFALSAATLVAPTYIVVAMLPRHRGQLERSLLASFLAGMPAIYLWGALSNHDSGGTLLEVVGLLVYATWALVGYRRSTMLLGMGIAAHGIGWDAWHLAHATYIEPWYPLGCLVVDIAFGLAVAGASYGQLAVAQNRL